MAKPIRRQGMLHAMFPDLPDWPESPRTAVLAFSSAQTFRSRNSCVTTIT